MTCIVRLWRFVEALSRGHWRGLRGGRCGQSNRLRSRACHGGCGQPADLPAATAPVTPPACSSLAWRRFPPAPVAELGVVRRLSSDEPIMLKVERKSRQTEVARTGRIPVGTDVHHHHLRNPSIGYLVRVIRATEALISSGECHPGWGKKRLVALQNMLEAKEDNLQKKRASK